MSSMTLKERLKARRDRLRETATSDDGSPRKLLPNEEEDESAGAAEMDSEKNDSEALMNDLKKRRKQAQKELKDAQKGSETEDGAQDRLITTRRRGRRRIKSPEAEGAQPDETTEASDTVTALNQDTSMTTTMDTTLGKSRTLESSKELEGSGKQRAAVRTKMLRASLKEKIKAVKDRGKGEAYEETRATNRKLKGKRNLPAQTRFDHPSVMRKEDYELEEMLQKSIAARSKWKESMKKKTSFLPTETEAYDFFTMVWEPEPEEKPTPEQGPSSSSEAGPAKAESSQPAEGEGEPSASTAQAGEEDKEEDDKKDKKKKVKPEEEPLLEPYDEATPAPWEFYQMGRAEYKPFHDKMEDENKMYFVPSMRAAPTQDKVFELPAPRYLEEEGFYVGTRPDVSLRNISRMENRLLQQKDINANWFGEDGRLITLPDPLKEAPARPPVAETADPALAADFTKAVMTDYSRRLIDSSEEGSGCYQLDVDINTLVFTHHHLFSREHVLAARLTSLYNNYVSRSKRKIVPFLTDKLKALKNAMAHVQENIKTIKEDDQPSEKGLLDQEGRLKEYIEEIKLTRKERDQEMGADRSLLKNIIDTWKEVKNLRQFQGFTNTPVKLKIHKESADKAADEKEWAADIEDEMEDLRATALVDHQRQMEQYQQSLDAWKKQKQQKKEAAKRQKKREKKQGQLETMEEGTEDERQQEEDERLLQEDDLEKPEKPAAMDVISEKQRIVARYQTIRRLPGEPKLYPEVTPGATVTANHLCARGEQQRRNEITRYKVFVKVLFNNKEVSRTPAKPLGQDFTVRFAQIFNVQIVQWPESITIQVYESAGLSSELLTEVYAVIPEANVTSETVQLDSMDFSSDQRVAHSHEGVGSGVEINFGSENSNMVSLMTTGMLTMGVAWAVNDDGAVLVPPPASSTQAHSVLKSLDAVAAIGAAGLSDMEQLSKWIAQSRLDPNDPSNADLLHRVKPGSAGGDFQVKNHFRLEQLQEEFNFTTDAELEANRRYKALRLREQEVPEFRALKPLPALEREVPDSVFDEYEKKLRENEKNRQQTDVPHRAVTAFMQMVREQVMQRFKRLRHEKTLADMVFEESVPNIGTILPNLLKMAEPRRPLKPVRKERKKMTAQNLKQEDVRLLINIVRAFDIPVREDALQGKTRPLSPGGGSTAGQDTLNRSLRQGTIKNIAGETLVRPFVEVMFQRHTQTTSVAEGPNPSWNEELQIPFRAPNDDYSPSSLQTIKDVLFINLFDEYVVDVLQDNRERGTSIHRRLERRWLGSIKIPFSTIYFNSRIDGTFRVNKPPVLLGYRHDPHNRTVEGGIDVGVGSSDHTFLTMFITVEPQLTPAEPVREKFDTDEPEKVMMEASKWLSDLGGRFPKREYKVTVVDMNGKAVLVTRYMKPLAPPEDLSPPDASPLQVAEMAARYVSLIPFASDSIMFPGVCDIWSTCDQFVQMLQGDEEEHAVLLTNYFLHLNKKAYLLLGSAIPEGPTAYVLTKEDNDYWIWNASTGEHFSYRDNYCPVQSVGCIVSADNVWANIQSQDQPCRIHFDLKNTSHWKPFFTKHLPNPGASSVQPERLLYTEIDKDYVAEVQDKMERTLREKIMEWRPQYITRWNRYCISTFRQILPKLESSRGQSSPQQMSEMEQLLGSYKLSGFPINMPYTGVQPLVEAVYATGVHNNETSDVEYALAVYVHPYPSSVYSVWAYVASLIRKR